MDFKYNRKLGAVILVIVLLLGTAYGYAKNKGDGKYAAAAFTSVA